MHLQNAASNRLNMLARLGKVLQKSKSKTQFYSTQRSSKAAAKYTDTINLPKTKFPVRLSAEKRSDTERLFVQGSFAGLYQHQQKNNSEPAFFLHDGPPYANGDLHMGHAVNKVLKDITTRQHVVNGRKVDFRPGWDCHGLPIELKALGGKSEVNSMEIRRKSREFATEASEVQRKGFLSWGVMGDWENPINLYKTYRPDYIQNEIQIFLDLYKKKLVYRDLKPVFWSPSSRSALAEAELEYDTQFVSPSILLRLKLMQMPDKLKNFKKDSQNIFAIIWTTTPWTLPSNQAVCYNPSLEYNLVKIDDDASSLYLIASKLIDDFSNLTNRNVETLTTIEGEFLECASYLHPIIRHIELPFIPSQHVQDNKGTGLVHTAPAHGPDDFLISLKYNIPITSFVNEKGEYTDDAPEFLISKPVLSEGNRAVIDHVQDDLLYSGSIVHSYPIDWRTKKPVIIRASNQWFINTEKIKTRAIEEINKVNIYPRINSEANKRAMITQLEKRPYWCISRQRSWGVPIPVFYEKSTGKPIINDETIEMICKALHKEGSMDYWWDENLNKYISKDFWHRFNLNSDEVKRGEDIFDIWFDSGISWSYAVPKTRIADLYLEGLDQFTGWFQSSLLLSVAYRNCTPYKSLFVHGFAVDEKGYKMSKSLGNVILPRDIIKKYGTDTLRWWVASHGTQHSSISVSDNLLQTSADALNKIRSTLKYLNGSVCEERNAQISDCSNYLDKYMRNELWKFDNEVRDAYDFYEYNRVTTLIQNFVANEISSIYLNSIKDRFYCGRRDEVATVRSVLKDCYLVLCKALWPIVPFLVEESWSYFDKESFYKTRIQTQTKWQDVDAERVIKTALELKQVFNQSVKGMNTRTLDVFVKCHGEKYDLLKALHPKTDEKLASSELCEILQVSSLTLSSKITPGVDIDHQIVDTCLCPRCRRFSVLDNEVVCKRCDKVLLENS